MTERHDDPRHRSDDAYWRQPSTNPVRSYGHEGDAYWQLRSTEPVRKSASFYSGPVISERNSIWMRFRQSWSSSPRLRELSWNTLAVVIGTVVAAGILALIALFWRHVI
jgi:hypothetical protein